MNWSIQKFQQSDRAGVRRAVATVLTIVLMIGTFAGCGGDSDSYDLTFRVLSGSENQALEPIIQDFAKDEKITVEITYQGSIDIMRELANGTSSRYDAVWPANSMWILLGDTTGTVQLSSSIMRSPVVFGVKKSVAKQLGWIGADVTVTDILAAAESEQLTFMMANAAQSDSGAAAYLGFLYAFAGHPDLLTSADLQSPEVRDKIKRILGTVSRTAGDSGYLKDLFVQEYDSYDAMVNYESAIIETNQTLVQSGREPLYVLYLRDGTAIADSPFAYIDKRDAEKRVTFQKLQAHLLSDDVQHQLLALGRRAGLGINPDPALVDQSVFNSDWGIDTQRILTPINIPDAAVVKEALTLYQTALRKPSLTVLALDFSSSMIGAGEGELKVAMRMLLDQESATQHLLQASPEDITIIIPFNDKVMNVWTVEGNDPAQFQSLIGQIGVTPARGGTDIYSPIIEGLKLIKKHGTDGYSPAVVVMTDGKSGDGKDFGDLYRYVALNGMESVPIFAITFGDASVDQLTEIANLSAGAVFNGNDDLVSAFRTVRGYT